VQRYSAAEPVIIKEFSNAQGSLVQTSVVMDATAAGLS
jgi:hypothetical protein